MRTFNRLPLSLLNTLWVKSQGKMNITYSLILCATIKECADNYTLEQWASRVDFNASPITKMLLPISPLCRWKVLRARAQENRRIPGVRALPFGFGFRRSAIVLCVKGGARTPLREQRRHSVPAALLFVTTLYFLHLQVSGKYYRHLFAGKTSENMCSLMGWYLKHRLTYSMDVVKNSSLISVITSCCDYTEIFYSCRDQIQEKVIYIRWIQSMNAWHLCQQNIKLNRNNIDSSWSALDSASPLWSPLFISTIVAL